MAAKRVGKSAIDWAKFAKLVPEYDRQSFNAFKARSDSYLMSVLSRPERAPEIDFKGYRDQINNKQVVEQLEQAYKTALAAVPYPKDEMTPKVDDEERRAAVETEQFCKYSNDKIKEAENLINKYKQMIPVPKMTREEYVLTFPDWNVTREAPSIWPNEEKTPGLSRQEAAELAKPDGPPYSIP